MDPFSHDCSTPFHDACLAYDLNLDDNAFVHILGELARGLARSRSLREKTGTQALLWSNLRRRWRMLADAQKSSLQSQDAGLIAVCVMLARFTRNLVADVPYNQIQGFECEPDIRRLLYHHTSWSAMENPDTFPAVRALTQALSNLVTANEALMSKLWETYMSLPEDQVIVIRLLASPDHRTLLAVLVFVLNCIHGSKDRAGKLCTTKIGIRICVSLLDRMVELYDAEESSDGGQAFNAGYNIFTRIMDAGLVPDLYSGLTVEDEIITPPQTTLLKLVDSYLQVQSPASPNGDSQNTVTITHRELVPMLSASFLALSAYAQEAIQQALAWIDATKSSTNYSSNRKRGRVNDMAFPASAWFEESPNVSDVELSVTETRTNAKASRHQDVPQQSPLSPKAELDVLLPKACEALVLITQCIVTVVLGEEYPIRNADDSFRSTFVQAVSTDGQGFIESLVELLRLLDIFLPRINFGKPVHTQPPDVDRAPVHHEEGFSYLKRDLVRLLAILCHRARAVQDQIRNCGGIPVVMNLCTLDDRNPYLREHAILALHNLMESNNENQEVVDGIIPVEDLQHGGNSVRDAPTIPGTQGS